MKAKGKTKVETKALIMQLAQGGMRRIEVPADWKVTFGAVAPGAGKGTAGTHYNGKMGWCLRVYETKDRVRAVFTDVMSFFEESLEISERVTKTKTQRMQRQGSKGFKDTVVEARVTEWQKVGADQDEDGDESLDTVFVELQDGIED